MVEPWSYKKLYLELPQVPVSRNPQSSLHPLEFSSGEEREARAVFSWEISNLESAVCFAFSSSAIFQVQQQKAVRKFYAPIR